MMTYIFMIDFVLPTCPKVLAHVIPANTRMLLVCLMVLGWNTESSMLVPHFWVLALVARCLDLI
jgi:hypothetical protein